MGEWCYRPPGGEAFTDVVVRVGQFIHDLGRAGPGRRVLVVAHDGVIIALRHVLAGIGAAAPEELPPVPYRLGVALERRRRPAASRPSGRLGRHRPPDLAGRRGWKEAHMNDHSPPTRSSPAWDRYPTARTHTRSTRRPSPTGR
ncbi:MULTISPECIES: histidine phosphatase family protein [unclassified Streptomyces]|uniref:histidine phosphatase family protein n=1 Tax=Streptomyces TaxID=1883 RepID=UPI0027955999|nr:histidine phosphatase family protein [Streptomyces sp. alain-838]